MIIGADIKRLLTYGRVGVTGDYAQQEMYFSRQAEKGPERKPSARTIVDYS